MSSVHVDPTVLLGCLDDGFTRAGRADPPPLAYGRIALLSQTLTAGGATLLPSVLRAMPSFTDPLVLDPEDCWFVGNDPPSEGIRVVNKYSVRSDGPRFSLRYTFVPRCPSDDANADPIIPEWVHPSLLEPDPPRGAGVKVHNRIFPYDELHAYCAKGTVNAIKYQAEDHAHDMPRVHVSLSRFDQDEERIVASLLKAHVAGRLTVDACHVEGGSQWYRFTSGLHTRDAFAALKSTPRLFTTTGRGGLRSVYEHLLRKHVLFYEKMARGVKKLAFDQLNWGDIKEIWDKYGAKHAPSTMAVAGCPPPLFWSGMSREERIDAQKALKKMPWKSAVMKPAILSKKSWKKQHARANAKMATCDGLSTPQIRNCVTKEEIQAETLHYCRYPYDRKPVLITDSSEPVANAQDYEGIIYVRPGLRTNNVAIDDGVKCVRVSTDSCDARHAAFLVQWFPLLFEHPAGHGENVVHPRVVERAGFYSAKCTEKAFAAAARIEEEDGAERRETEADLKKYERLTAEFDALRCFSYPGCHTGCD